MTRAMLALVFAMGWVFPFLPASATEAFRAVVANVGSEWDPDGKPTTDVGGEWDPNGGPTPDVGSDWDPNG
jgi:hypothetical protein